METMIAQKEAQLQQAARSRPSNMKDNQIGAEAESDHPRSIFRDWMLQHLDDPFPSAADRRKLITQVRLSPDESTQQGALDATAVKNFFQNLRRRSGFTSLLRECFNEDRYRCGEAVRRVMKGITDEERAKETPEQRMARERIERIRDYVAGKFESTKVGDWLKSVSPKSAMRASADASRQVIDEHKLSGARARSVSVAPSSTSTGSARKKQRVASNSSVASSVSAASNALDESHDRYHKPSSHHRIPSTLSPCFSSPSMRSSSGSSSISGVSDALLRTPGRSVSGSSAASSSSFDTPAGGMSVVGSPAGTYSAGSPSESIAPTDPGCLEDRILAADERRAPYSHQIPRVSHRSSSPHAGDLDQPAWVPVGDIRDLDPALAADLGFVLPEQAGFRSQHHDLDPLIDPSLQEDDGPYHLPLDFDFRPALPPAVDSLILPEVPAWHDPDEPFQGFNFWVPLPATHHPSRDHHPLGPTIDVHPPSAQQLLSEGYTESPVELTPSVVREQGACLPRKTGKRKDAGTRTAQAASTSPEPDLSIEDDVEAEAGPLKSQASKKPRGTGQKSKQQLKKPAKQPKQKIIKVYSFD